MPNIGFVNFVEPLLFFQLVGVPGALSVPAVVQHCKATQRVGVGAVTHTAQPRRTIIHCDDLAAACG